jgi:hypothetical protein
MSPVLVNVWLLKVSMRNSSGPVDIGVDYHEAAGDRADTTFHVRDVAVEFHRLDPGILEAAADVGDQDGIICAQ